MKQITLKDENGMTVRYITPNEFEYFGIDGPVGVGKFFDCSPLDFTVVVAGEVVDDVQECVVSIAASVN